MRAPCTHLLNVCRMIWCFYLKSWTNIVIGHIWWSNTNVINLILRVMSHLPYITCDNENIHPKSHSRKLTFPTICCEKCWSITNLPFPSLLSKPYRWCSGRLITSSALDRGVDLQLSQTKDITIGIWCLHTGSKSNDWLAWNQGSVSYWNDISNRELLLQWISNLKYSGPYAKRTSSSFRQMYIFQISVDVI
jgi:hypothetical protein